MCVLSFPSVTSKHVNVCDIWINDHKISFHVENIIQISPAQWWSLCSFPGPLLLIDSAETKIGIMVPVYDYIDLNEWDGGYSSQP